MISKQGLSTIKTDTNFWADISSNVTPISDGWLRIVADNSAGSNIKWSNFFIKKYALKNMKPNTDYTIMLETRNRQGNFNTICVTSVPSSTNKDIFTTSTYVLYSNIADKQKFKKTTVSDLSVAYIGVRGYLQTIPGQSGSIEIRLTLVEGDYTNKSLQWTKYRDSSIVFPLVEPLRALECTSSDAYNLVKNGKYYIADYVDWKNKEVVRNFAKITLNGTQLIYYNTSYVDTIRFDCQLLTNR